MRVGLRGAREVTATALEPGTSQPTLYELMEKLWDRRGFVGDALRAAPVLPFSSDRLTSVTRRGRNLQVIGAEWIAGKLEDRGARGYVGILYKDGRPTVDTRGQQSAWSS